MLEVKLPIETDKSEGEPLLNKPHIETDETITRVNQFYKYAGVAALALGGAEIGLSFSLLYYGYSIFITEALIMTGIIHGTAGLITSLSEWKGTFFKEENNQNDEQAVNTYHSKPYSSIRV